jgi:hypothetical protein
MKEHTRVDANNVVSIKADTKPGDIPSNGQLLRAVPQDESGWHEQAKNKTRATDDHLACRSNRGTRIKTKVQMKLVNISKDLLATGGADDPAQDRAIIGVNENCRAIGQLHHCARFVCLAICNEPTRAGANCCCTFPMSSAAGKARRWVLTYQRLGCNQCSISPSKAMMLPVRPRMTRNTAESSPSHRCIFRTYFINSASR